MVNQINLFEAIVTGKPVKEFFNTIHLAEPELTSAKEQTHIQDGRVLSLFRELGKMTPIECWKIYCENHGFCVLTSIRRSVTVLTRRGKLTKLSEMKKEVYGKVNHLWEIAAVETN